MARTYLTTLVLSFNVAAMIHLVSLPANLSNYISFMVSATYATLQVLSLVQRHKGMKIQFAASPWVRKLLSRKP